MSTAAYGAGKAGATFDPMTFVKKPQVVLKLICVVVGVIGFWSLSLGFLSLLTAAGFLVGEYFFEQMSSARSRKHFVIGDMVFSGIWAVIYFLVFCYLANQWIDTPDKDIPELAPGDLFGAVLFSLFSIFIWAGSAWFAYQRFLQGVEGMDVPAMPEAAQYNSYPDTEGGEEYQQPPAY